MIHNDFGNNRTSQEQADADRYTFEQMRRADEEKFDGRPEWLPVTDVNDSLEDRLQRQIRRVAAQVAENRRILEEARERHEGFLDEEFIRRGQF